MRIAILSDIHGNLAACEAVVSDIGRRGVDAVINLGDSLSGPLLPKETAQFLMTQEWVHLAGNHERQMLSLGPENHGLSDAYALSQLSENELAWMASLSAVRTFEDNIYLCHGTPGSDEEYFLETVEPTMVRPAHPAEIEMRLRGISLPVVLCGHTHVSRNVRSRHGQFILNPGSVGCPAYTDEKPYPHVIETGSPDARYAIVTKRDGRWGSEMITVPYDHVGMANLAHIHGRKDWESALLYGIVEKADAHQENGQQ